ncbi:MAG: hypothetical protein Q7K65_01020 [Candidatus Buchananbacteria bacterium]|nr:hypothetical protein [Candidatus Buchananbacteria bacterium]
MDIVFGVIFVLLGVVGMGGSIWLYLTHKNMMNRINQSLSPSRAKVYDEVIPSSDRRRQLKEASSGQTITLIGEPERAVQSSIILNEMYQSSSNAPWSRTGSSSKALVLSGGIWIFKIPSREAGRPTWLKGKEISSTGLGRFYKGTSEAPGPARIFKQNDQTDPVPYSLPNNLTPNIIWEVVDIGTFDAEVDRENDNINSGDRLYFVTSKEQNGQRWLIYLDARKGEAKGSGGLFSLEEFEPSVDVTDLL